MVYYSAHVPTVAINHTPSDGQAVPLQAEATVRVEWTGSDADGDSLLYSILYSPNEGQTWLTLSFEQMEAAFDVPVDPESNSHRVRAIATDGTQSAVDEIGFTLGLRLLDHAMARSIDSDTLHPASRTDAFLTTDEQAINWIKIGPMSTTHEVEWNWYSPQGDLYLNQGPVAVGEVGQRHDWWAAWATIDSAESAASSFPGLWTVEVFLDGRPLVTEQFTLREP